MQKSVYNIFSNSQLFISFVALTLNFMNILIVEDHPELAQEIVDYLSKNGYLCK